MALFFLLVPDPHQTLWAKDKKETITPGVTRVSPPERWDEETEQLFKADPSERLRGSRKRQSRGETKDVDSTERTENTPLGLGHVSWAELISTDAVEDEIKSIYPQMGKHLVRVGGFKSGSHKEVEQQFAELATMFGILAAHPEATRWKKSAAGARDLFSSASRNARVSSTQAFKDAKNRYEDLGQLIRGESIELTGTQSVPWSEVAERRMLMQRLEKAYTQNMKVWSADQVAFEKNQSAVIHEAQIIVALARIIALPEYDYHEDEEYAAYCSQLEQHAKHLELGARESDLQKVQLHMGELHKTCGRCHEDYK